MEYGVIVIFLAEQSFCVEHSMCSVDVASVVGRLGFVASTSGTFSNRVWFVRLPPPSWLAGVSAVAALEEREGNAAVRVGGGER